MKTSSICVFYSALMGVLLTQSHEVMAEVYKCPDSKQGVVFSDAPCPNGVKKVGEKWVSVEEEAQKKLKQEDDERQRKLEEEKVNANEVRAREQRRLEIIEKAKTLGLYVLEYVVEGSASSARLTYNNEQGGTEQKEVSLPWRTMLRARKGDFAYVSAQNKNSYGEVVVKILVNDVPVKTSQSSGAYAIASASGRI